MIDICIASGKGGTGKTLIATNMAAALGEKCDYLDCDVDEPNGHIFLRQSNTQWRPIYSDIPEHDTEKCDFCKKCSEICRFNSLVVLDKSLLFFPELCHGCGGCIEICPQKALLPGKKEIGDVCSGLYHQTVCHEGKLKIGETMAPRIIKELKNTPTAKRIRILDGPPGTSCPAVTTMKGSDYILLVTESTPFGLHDLTLAHQTAKQLDVECGLIINRDGIGDDSVHKYALEQNLTIHMQIPYERNIAKLYSQGRLLINEFPQYIKAFKQMYMDIENAVHRRRGEQ